MVKTALLEKLDAAWSTRVELLLELIVPCTLFRVPENSTLLPEKSNTDPLPKAIP